MSRKAPSWARLGAPWAGWELERDIILTGLSLMLMLFFIFVAVGITVIIVIMMNAVIVIVC